MRLPRVRFTVRQVMALIVVAAALLAVAHQIKEGRRLRSEIEMNQVAQAELKVMSKDARRRNDPPEEVEDYARSLVELRKEEQRLRQKLSRLWP